MRAAGRGLQGALLIYSEEEELSIMLELKNVKKSYDGTPVLTDISLNIEDVTLHSHRCMSTSRTEDMRSTRSK